MEKDLSSISLFFALMLALAASSAFALEAPKAGDTINDVSFVAPASQADLDYLGIKKGEASFTVGKVKAPVVVVQLFSMYCTYCQEEAPQVNEFYNLLQQKGLRDTIKIFGVGMRNSKMETDLFRKKFKVVFPLLPDHDGAVHTKLGSPMTPFFLIVDNRNGGKIIFTHLGAMPSAESFLQSVIDKAGLK